MANPFWNHITRLVTRQVSVTPTINANNDGIAAGFDAVKTAIDAKLDDSQAGVTGLAVLGSTSQAAARTAMGLGSAATSASTDFAPAAHVGATGTAHGNATTSVAGFMSSTDKSKLDGVASNATANPNTDSLTEGSTNQYFTAARVRAVVLTGLSVATNAAITAADTILVALGKLQAQITAHFGATGTAHGNATTSVAGFMSSTDKTKLDGVQANATANAGDATLLSRNNHTGTQAISTITGLQSALDAKLDDSQATTFGLSLLGAADAAAAKTTLGAANSTHSHTLSEISDLVSVSETWMRNKIRNSNFAISKRTLPITNASGYTMDGWILQKWTTGAQFTVDSPTDLQLPGRFSGKCMSVVCTTADATVGSDDLVSIDQYIESNAIGDLIGQPVSVRFHAKSNVAGTYSATLRAINGAMVYSWINTFTLAADTWTDVSFTTSIPNSTYVNQFVETKGLIFSIGLMGGSTYQGATSTWNITNRVVASGNVNFASTVGNEFRLAGVQIVRCNGCPDYYQPPAWAEEERNNRYLQRVSGRAMTNDSDVATAITAHSNYISTMRATPTATILAESVVTNAPTRSVAPMNNRSYYYTAQGGAPGWVVWEFDCLFSAELS